jgi:mannose-6-phosphate isomerase
MDVTPHSNRAPIERLTPAVVGRPWGRGRFGSVNSEPVGEVWVSGDDARLPDGSTLVASGIAREVPLVKLLDVGDWLSVQLHPSNELAHRLHGPDAVGKHEAWVVLEADDAARLAAGLVDPGRGDDLFAGDRGRVEAALRFLDARPGDLFDIPPGTVHAPGPGLLLYEIQQRSDLTYRVWDWGRRGRALHLDEARQALQVDAVVRERRLPAGEGRYTLISNGRFRLELWRVRDAALSGKLDRSAVLSVIEGSVAATAGSWNDQPGLEAASHWLVQATALRLRGSGAALVATRSPEHD